MVFPKNWNKFLVNLLEKNNNSMEAPHNSIWIIYLNKACFLKWKTHKAKPDRLEGEIRQSHNQIF